MTHVHPSNVDFKSSSFHGEEGARQDGELLSRFVQHCDSAAFGQLVERHAEMVLGVCYRILQQQQDAEDACQAVFLILARKASVISQRESVASWLYGVACRTSWNLRRTTNRRRKIETAALRSLTNAEMLEGERIQSNSSRSDAENLGELRRILDLELNGLPEELRAPLALCYFEGRGRDEAAAILGWSLSTLKGRLSRGRRVLQSRLRKRGFVFTFPLFALKFSQETVQAATESWIANTVLAASDFAKGHVSSAVGQNRQVISIAERTLAKMSLLKLKLTAICTLSAALLVGSSLAIQQALANPGVTHPAQKTRAIVASGSPMPDDAERDPLPSESKAVPVTAQAHLKPNPLLNEDRLQREDKAPASSFEVALNENDQPNPSNKSTSASIVVNQPQTRVMPKVQVGEYTVSVQSARWLRDGEVDIVASHKPLRTPDLSELQNMMPSGGKSLIQFGGAGAAGIASKPDLVIDLKVEVPLATKRKVFVEVAGKARGLDRLKHELSSVDLPEVMKWNVRDANGETIDHVDTVFLKVANHADDKLSDLLTELDGTLIVTEGKSAEFQFQKKDLNSKLKKGISRKSDGIVLTLNAIRKNTDGIEIDVSYTLPSAHNNLANPAALTIPSPPTLTAVLIDAAGKELVVVGQQTQSSNTNSQQGFSNGKAVGQSQVIKQFPNQKGPASGGGAFGVNGGAGGGSTGGAGNFQKSFQQSGTTSLGGQFQSSTTIVNSQSNLNGNGGVGGHFVNGNAVGASGGFGNAGGFSGGSSSAGGGSSAGGSSSAGGFGNGLGGIGGAGSSYQNSFGVPTGFGGLGNGTSASFGGLPLPAQTATQYRTTLKFQSPTPDTKLESLSLSLAHAIGKTSRIPFQLKNIPLSEHDDDDKPE